MRRSYPFLTPYLRLDAITSLPLFVCLRRSLDGLSLLSHHQLVIFTCTYNLCIRGGAFFYIEGA